MDIRADVEMTVQLSFQVSVPIKDVLAKGGIEEFTKQVRESLEDQIKPLLDLLPQPEPDADQEKQGKDPVILEAPEPKAEVAKKA